MITNARISITCPQGKYVEDLDLTIDLTREGALVSSKELACSVRAAAATLGVTPVSLWLAVKQLCAEQVFATPVIAHLADFRGT